MSVCICFEMDVDGRLQTAVEVLFAEVKGFDEDDDGGRIGSEAGCFVR